MKLVKIATNVDPERIMWLRVMVLSITCVR